MNTITIAIGCDHAGFTMKSELLEVLREKGFQILDFGTHGTDSVDYPDFVHPVAKAILNGNAYMGIIMCGSGNGVAITANKYKGIRAALCWNEEIASLARLHNDANILALPVRFINLAQLHSIVDQFLNTPFEGGRHAGRVCKIDPEQD
jgi:ribose 5-phosphate isomerase B